MKTSNKLLIAVTAILISYLVVYDLALRAEYVKGEYKSRFYKMASINVKDFNAIQNNLGNNFGVDIEYGPTFGVWINDNVKGAVVFTQQGKTLNLDLKIGNKDQHYGGKAIIITCPILNSVTIALPGQKQLVNYWTVNTITGFAQPTMKLHLKPFTKVELQNNNLSQLNAVIESAIGDSNFDNGFTIAQNNKIKVANIKTLAGGHPRITLMAPVIDKVNYDLADSTQLTLSGKLLQTLKQ